MKIIKYKFFLCATFILGCSNNDLSQDTKVDYQKTIVGSHASHSYNNICDITDKYPNIILGTVNRIEGFYDTDIGPRTNLSVSGSDIMNLNEELDFNFLTLGGPLKDNVGIQTWSYEVEVGKQYIFFTSKDSKGIDHLFEFSVMNQKDCTPIAFGNNGIYESITIEDMITHMSTCESNRLETYPKISEDVECLIENHTEEIDMRDNH